MRVAQRGGSVMPVYDVIGDQSSAKSAMRIGIPAGYPVTGKVPGVWRLQLRGYYLLLSSQSDLPRLCLCHDVLYILVSTASFQDDLRILFSSTPAICPLCSSRQAEPVHILLIGRHSPLQMAAALLVKGTPLLPISSVTFSSSMHRSPFPDLECPSNAGKTLTKQHSALSLLPHHFSSATVAAQK